MSFSKTDRQIEVETLLRSTGQNMSEDIIDEILRSVGTDDKFIEEEQTLNSESLIKLQIVNETDWRKRAILSAMLISKSLE